ncbi:MAG TPA: DUF4838 domain-containing protein [Clostridiaceae bacterium]|nr:DUF4838 domain-containing protein [Clostridiaceae bacterium]
MLNNLKIYYDSSDKTLTFAAQELGKYSSMIQKDLNVVYLTNCKDNCNETCNEDNTICLGLFKDFGIESKMKDYTDFDDEIYIDVSNGKGVIAGINPRSTLLAVYRFLTEAGCAWVRPGKDGEYIPTKEFSIISVKVHETASYRHRGICIEGANSYENIENIIDWAPKVGFNAYFFQFREAFTFFERWYSHKNNPLKKPEPFTVDMAREYVKRAVNEIKKRGLIYHAVGHGWTCEPLGIPGLSWEKDEYDVKPEVVKFFAEVNGKRELWGGIPLNTNLCYSNPEVREIITDAIVQYLKENPEVDILHFWLADGSNNQCECENCRKRIPSDFYVIMLNELDKKLSAENINTKIVFLIYVDLLWAPEYEKIENPDRFILMFAPITRTYSHAFETDEELPEIPAYTRNKLKFPKSVKENLAFLKAWEKAFKGDSFDFDYHFMWDHYMDPGYYQIAEILSKDIKNLSKINLNGYVSCQTQRAFFPTGLGMYVMGATLWNSELDFEELADNYFKNAFGTDWMKCKEYLSKLSDLFDPPYMRGEKEIISEEAAKRFSSIVTYIDDFRKVIDANTNSIENDCHKASWNYLRYHADLSSLLALALEARAQGNNDKAAAIWKITEKYAQEHEDNLQTVLDVYLFIHTLKSRLKFGRSN